MKSLKVGALLLVSLVAVQLHANPASSQGIIRVRVDGQLVGFDQPPIVVQARVLVPLRGVFEKIGAEVTWNEETRTVLVVRAKTQVRLRVGSRMAQVDDRIMRLDAPPVLVNRRVFIPLRFVGEALGARVTWNQVMRIVSVIAPVESAPVPPPSSQSPTTPPKGALLSGIVVQVDVNAAPQRIVVQSTAGPAQAFSVTPQTAITRVNVDTNRATLIILDQVYPGHLVLLSVEVGGGPPPQGTAHWIQVRVREVAGRVRNLSDSMIVLEGNLVFTLSRNVQFFIRGKPVAREQLQSGTEVILRINPFAGEVVEVVGL